MRWSISVLFVLAYSSCFGQTGELAIGGKQFRLGMRKLDALRLVPVRPEGARELHSEDMGDSDSFTINQGNAQLGMLAFRGGVTTCVVSNDSIFPDAKPVSSLATALFPFLKRISGSSGVPIVFSVTTTDAAGTIIETARLTKGPYQYELTWLHPGFPEGGISLSTAIGTCGPPKK